MILVTPAYREWSGKPIQMEKKSSERFAPIGEHNVRQRAQRRGLSLRKTRSIKNGGHSTNYWLVSAPENNIIAGGDAGLSLEEIVALLSTPLTSAAVSTH